jgi:hypothetical protein
MEADAPHEVPHVDAATDLPRAGVWRRWLAWLIDSIVVVLPFQTLAAVLFAMTAGTVQMDSGFFSICAPVKTVPQSLDPPPPHDPNFARVCRVTFFGATTGVILTVGRVTKEGLTTTSVSQNYRLDSEGKPINGTSIDGIVWLVLLLYLVGMIWKTGRTLGARCLGIRVADAAEPGATAVPLRKVIVRYLAMAIGVAPMIAALVYQRVTKGSADAMFTADFFRWFTFAAIFAGLWMIVLIYQIARKTDPVYDRLAGTAVLRNPGVVAANT